MQRGFDSGTKNSPADVFTKPKPRPFASNVPRGKDFAFPRVECFLDLRFGRAMEAYSPMRDLAVSSATWSWKFSSAPSGFATSMSGTTPTPLISCPSGVR